MKALTMRAFFYPFKTTEGCPEAVLREKAREVIATQLSARHQLGDALEATRRILPVSVAQRWVRQHRVARDALDVSYPGAHIIRLLLVRNSVYSTIVSNLRRKALSAAECIRSQLVKIHHSSAQKRLKQLLGSRGKKYADPQHIAFLIPLTFVS